MPSGILLLDKPLGLSSNAVLQRVRTLFLRQKAGHVGSLDPLATGMLPICLGEATKIAGQILAGRKRYRFTLALGTGTATGDVEGAVTRTAPVPPFERAAVEALLALLALGPASLELEALCSKGTYIRVLAEDLAAALGTCGHVVALRRLYVEPFEKEPMHTLESLAETRARGDWPALLACDWPLGHLTAVRLTASEARRLLSGQSVMVEVAGAAAVRLYDEAGTFLGLGEADGRGAVRPRRLLNAAL